MKNLQKMVTEWRSRARSLSIPQLMEAANELQDWIDEKCNDPRRPDWCQVRSNVVEPLAMEDLLSDEDFDSCI